MGNFYSVIYLFGKLVKALGSYQEQRLRKSSSSGYALDMGGEMLLRQICPSKNKISELSKVTLYDAWNLKFEGDKIKPTLIKHIDAAVDQN